jgi:hypothetical protein
MVTLMLLRLVVHSKTTLNFQAQDEAGEKIYVYYSDEEKKAGVGIKPIRRCVTIQMDQTGISTV